MIIFHKSKNVKNVPKAPRIEKALASIPEAVAFQGESRPVNPHVLIRLARGATILDPNDEQHVRFYHQLLQEYFAALELKRRFELGEDLSTDWEAPRLAKEMPETKAGEWDPLPAPPTTGWEMTTIIATEMVLSPGDFVDAVRPHNPALAGRCILETRAALPEEVKRSVKEALRSDFCNPKIHLRARLQAGHVLGRIGDPRFKPRRIKGIEAILPQIVPVPSGTYHLGSREKDRDAFPDERPLHPVDLDGFSIGRWPVTNAEFECFMKAGGYGDESLWKGDLAQRWLRGEDVSGGLLNPYLEVWEYLQKNPGWKEELRSKGLDEPGRLKYFEHISSLSKDELITELGDRVKKKSRRQPQFWDERDVNNPSQPVVGITWFEAKAYCEWLSWITGTAFRLPTEAEWEAAARGLKGLPYPWGGKWDPGLANTMEGRVLKTSPVGAYGAGGAKGPFGAEDQCGNVWEWTSSLYIPYPYDRARQEDPEAEGHRVLRGGSWDFYRGCARCAYRGRVVPGTFDDDVGFRVVSPGLVSDS